MTRPFGLVLPVKLLTLAKTRLQVYGDRVRADLALAFADDVVTAALTSGAVDLVLVVSDEPRASTLGRPGVRLVPDVPRAGLNPALEHGAGLLRAERPGRGVAALSSDLPALRADDLAAALADVHDRAFAPDAAGSGTTLLAAVAGRELEPAYGPGSRRRHLASGARELAAGPSLRRDVDTPEDLRDALHLGVGTRTATVLGTLALAGRSRP